MATENEDTFWESRQVVRSRIHLIHMVYASFMAAYFGTVTPSLRYLAVVSSIFYFLEPRMGKRYLNSRLIFWDISVCAVTLIGAYNFTLLAWKDVPPEFMFNSMPLQARGMMVKMMNGQVPFPTIGTFITPILLSSAGMSLPIAKLATLLHVVIFMSTLVAIFRKTQSESCVLNGNTENHCLGNFVHDVSSFSMVIVMAMFSCVPSAQISEDFVNLLRDGRHADSVLNHILKNSIAGAASLIEVGLEEEGENLQAKRTFESALDQLYRTMSWCASRQVMLDLAAGKYVTVHSPVNVPKFLKSVAAGATQVVTRDLTKRDVGDSKVDVAFDEKLARLALENAKTNAIAHGGDGRILIGAEIIHKETGTPAAVLTVRNSVPDSKLSNGALKEVVSGVVNGAGGASRARNEPRSVKVAKDATSTGAGLSHIHLACQGAGGRFNLELDEKSSEVVCSITLPAQLIPRPTQEVATMEPQPPGGAAAPEPPIQPHTHSRVPANRRALSPTAPETTTAGQPEQPPSPLPTQTSPSHHSALVTGLPPGCKMLAIDDSAILCKGYSRIVLPLLKADKQRSRVVCPTSRTEVDAFVDSALGHNTDGSSDPADIVILDQNIDLGGGDKTVLGTDLADRLRSGGFQGYILIRSANAASEDRSNYLESGAVDGCINKDGSNKDVVASIHRMYAIKMQQQAQRGAIQEEKGS